MKENTKKLNMFLPAAALAAGFAVVLQAGLLFLSGCSSETPQEDIPKTITLSGTISVTFESNIVPYLEIGVDASGADWIAYTGLDSPQTNTRWSIEIPAFSSPTKITFRIQGYDELKNRLFFAVDEVPIIVHNEDVWRILLRFGNILPPTPRNVIPINDGTWCEGDITIDGYLEWYSFNVEYGNEYYIWWNDTRDGDNTKTLDIDVFAFYTGDLITDVHQIPLKNDDDVENNDKAWEKPVSFTADADRTVYLRARALNWSKATGTYAIVYSTNNSARPTGGDDNPLPGVEKNPIQLTNGAWTNASLPSGVSGRTIWYSFDVVQGTKYNIWWDDSYEGSGSMTLDIKADADSMLIFAEADSAWNEPMSFTAASNGKVRLKVTSFFRFAEGTFAITYSTEDTRPSR